MQFLDLYPESSEHDGGICNIANLMLKVNQLRWILGFIFWGAREPRTWSQYARRDWNSAHWIALFHMVIRKDPRMDLTIGPQVIKRAHADFYAAGRNPSLEKAWCVMSRQT
jgi:hypothetical protein